MIVQKFDRLRKNLNEKSKTTSDNNTLKNNKAALQHQEIVRRITENDKLITMTTLEKKYMKNMKNAPSTLMNQTMQDCSSMKNVVSVSKQKALMQATSTTGWFGIKKGMGSDLKNTDFDEMIHPSRLRS